MEGAKGSGNSADEDHQLGPGGSLTHGAGDVPLSSSADEQANVAAAVAGGRSEQMETFHNDIPVFLDRTFRMIESISTDIVCWSQTGDSFIIKQARRDKELKAKT